MWSLTRITKLIVSLCCGWVLACSVSVAARQSSPTSNAAAKSVGTIKTISGRTITLAADSGGEVTVVLEEGARLLRVEPGEKDLKQAAGLDLQDLQPGDRILVRGQTAADGKSLLAISLIAMKKLDIAQKQAREREDWQRHGVGGLVSAVDLSTGTITITTQALGPNKTVEVHTSKDTVLRRYAANSIKFDDAKTAPIRDIKPGDQLRARGVRSADGAELTAQEVVSGSFRNIAGTISSISTSDGSITVLDLATKKPVAVKITAESQLRKLSPPMAQRIASRLKGTPPEAGDSTARPRSGEAPATKSTGESSPAGGRDSSQGPSDLQQAINRMAPASLGDLNKGDAVMIVASSGTKEGETIAITLLAGVEPILESPRAQSILTPWSLSSGGAEAAAP
jgi:Domain of unknown function (DUF5666)